MRQKVVRVWYENDKNLVGYAGTGLLLELEDGTILHHQSTDTIMPFEAE